MRHLPRAGNAAYHNIHEVYNYIVDPNERRRLALAEIDKSPFSWYHVRTVVVTGVGFFTDSYSIFAINLATAMLGIVYWQDGGNKGTIKASADTALKVSTSIGTMVGQVVFGHLADVFGRKRMYGVELMIIITCTLGQALTSSSIATSFVGIIAFWRTLMGFGIGGDYPLSAVITAEFASTKHRGAMIAAVFAMQGFGQFVAAMVAFIVVAAHKDTLSAVSKPSECLGDCQIAADRMWRILIGFGAIPGWFALYYRLTIPETPRYTFDVMLDVERATADAKKFRSGKIGKAAVDNVRAAKVRSEISRNYRTGQPTLTEYWRYISRWRNLLVLLGTAGSWFFLDIAFYGITLNNSNVINAIGFGGKENVYRRIRNQAVGTLILTCAGAIPGYWVTVFTVDRIGRKPIQLAGFIVLAILFCVIGFRFDHLGPRGLLVLYIFSQFFFNFGPNATTFLIPGECFPTRFRATSHGISAAAGKLGATLAQVAFAPLAHRGHSAAAGDSPWLKHLMKVFALFMFCGIFTSLLVPESKGKSLEELCGDDDRSQVYEMRVNATPSPPHTVDSQQYLVQRLQPSPEMKKDPSYRW